MKFKHFFLLPAMLFLATTLYSQVGIGTTDPSQAAMLEISSQTNGTGDYKGFMPPRVPNVAARNSIDASSTDIGLLIFVESLKCLQMWNGTGWENVKCFTTDPSLLAKQEFETTPSNPLLPIFNMTNGEFKTGNGAFPSTPMYAGGSQGYGTSSNSAVTVVLGPIDASGNSSATFRLRLAAFSTTAGNGMDEGDYVIISISTTGVSGSFSKELEIIGGVNIDSNNKWGFNSSGIAATIYDNDDSPTSYIADSTGITYLEITGIPNSPNIAFKVEMRKNVTNEIWVIDNAEIWGN